MENEMNNKFTYEFDSFVMTFEVDRCEKMHIMTVFLNGQKIGCLGRFKTLDDATDTMKSLASVARHFKTLNDLADYTRSQLEN